MQSSKQKYKEYRKLRGFWGQKPLPGEEPRDIVSRILRKLHIVKKKVEEQPAEGKEKAEDAKDKPQAVPQNPAPKGGGGGMGKMMRGMGGGGFGGMRGGGMGRHGGFGGGPMPSPDGNARKRPLPYYLKRYVKIIGEYKGHVAILVVISLVGLFFQAVTPWTSKFMLDYVFTPEHKTINLGPFFNDFLFNRGKMHLLMWTCIVLAAISLTELILGIIAEFTSRLLSAKLQVNVRRKMIKHMQSMPLARLENLKTGGIISRLEGDTGAFAGLLHSGFLSPLSSLCMFIIGLGSLLLVNATVTLICTGFIFLLGIVMLLVFNIMRPLFRDLQEDGSRISGKLAETFGGIRVVRIFGREMRETRDYISLHNLLIRKSLHTAKLNICVHRMIQLLSIGMGVTIWAVGGYFVISKKITIGDLMVFTRFVHWFFHPVFMIIGSLSSVQGSLACTERIFDMLDEEITIKDKPDAIPAEAVHESIDFDHVTFEYEENTPVLKDLNLKVPVGKTLALVGPSGAGKTTITNLMVRFYEPKEGAVRLDGRDIRDFKLGSYRSLYSLVLQDVFLFDGTIAENISYSMPDATPEQIVAAAKIAAADEFIEQFADKYDTVIGERGVRLSGGQKQRISLARAVLRDPQILILDEATSSLDSESEALIQTALKDILKDRTTVVIAHRLSTIMDADSIAVIVDGAVVEQGTHQELLARNGKYAEMYRKQMEKAMPDPTKLIWTDEAESAKK